MPDKRLIDANALDKALVQEYIMYNDVNTVLTLNGVQVFNAAIDTARSKIGETPTIDAVPVVHAYWKEYLGEGYTGCSKCSFVPYSINDRYCPNCGARMDGGAEC